LYSLLLFVNEKSVIFIFSPIERLTKLAAVRRRTV
jgi:hypothetical protein